MRKYLWKIALRERELMGNLEKSVTHQQVCFLLPAAGSRAGELGMFERGNGNLNLTEKKGFRQRNRR